MVVIGHMGAIPDAVRTVIAPTDLLFVPIFFYLSGYLFNPAKYTTATFIRRKLKTLLLPYACITLLVSLLDWNLYLDTRQFLPQTIHSFVLGDGALKASPLWFVSTLFCANILLRCIHCLRNKLCRLVICILLAALCYVLYAHHIRLPLRLDSALGATFLMGIAYEIKAYAFSKPLRIVLFAVSCIVFAIGMWQHAGLLNYNSRHLAISFPAALAGCFAASELLRSLVRREAKWHAPFLWIARNGMFVLGFHCYIAFALDIPLRFISFPATAEFILKFAAVLLVLRLVAFPILKRVHPEAWGIATSH